MAIDTDEVAPRVASIPLQDAIGDAPDEKPKRGRGRPRNEDSAPRTRRATVRKAPLKTRVGASLIKVNVAIMVAARFAPGLDAEKDPLSSYEITALADGLVAQADAHPTFRKYLEAFATATDGADLILVAAVILARRGARRGLLPADVDTYGGAIVGEPDALAAIMSSPDLQAQLASMMAADAPATAPE